MKMYELKSGEIYSVNGGLYSIWAIFGTWAVAQLMWWDRALIPIRANNSVTYYVACLVPVLGGLAADKFVNLVIDNFLKSEMNLSQENNKKNKYQL
jgi:hypothetical protein